MSSKLGILPQADGSALFQLGNTRVLATVNGPREPRQRNASHDRVHITVQFHVATFSSVGGERRRLRQDRRLDEWSRYLEDVFTTAIVGTLFPRSQIEIHVEVLNADGSVLPTAINAVTLALINAGVPLYDYVVATSVGHLGKTPLLDVNRLEEGGPTSGAPSMTIAAYGRAPTMSLLVTQDGRLPLDKLESMTELSRSGIRKLFELMDISTVRPVLEDLSESRRS